MKLLKVVKDLENYGPEDVKDSREAVRCVLIDSAGMVPILWVGKYEYHKIPGGGIDEGETVLDALSRECMEEVGAKIEVIAELGKIVEFRSEWEFEQTSFGYIGRIVEKGEVNFTEKEVSNGFELIWVSIDDAIKILQNDTPLDYEGKFIQKRDLEFLKIAKNKFNN